MSKPVLLLFAALLFVLSSKAQSNFSNSSAPEKIANFNAKYQFEKVGAWDYDMDQWRSDHPPYIAKTTIVVRINANSGGNIFIAQDGYEKRTYNIVDSKIEKDKLTFTWLTGKGEKGSIFLFTKRKRVFQAHVVSPSTVDNANTIIVYF